MKNLLINILVLGLLSFSAKASEQPYCILSDTSHTKLIPYLYLTESADSFPQIKNADYRFFKANEQLAHDKEHWFRFYLVNSGNFSNKYIIKATSKSAWRCNYLSAQVFLGDSVQYFRFGNIEKMSRLIGTDTRGEFALYIAKGDTATVYLKVSNVVGHYPKFDLQIYPFGTSEKSNTRHSFQMVYQGLMWITALVSFFIFFLYHEKLYVYYSLYIATTAVYILFFHRYLLNFAYTEHPMWDPYVWILSISLAPLFYLLLLKHFVETQKLWGKQWQLALNTLIYGKLVIIIGELVAYTLIGNIRILNNFIGVLITMETLSSVAFVFRLMLTKNVKVYYFGAASLFIWLGFILANTMYILNINNAHILGEIGVVGGILLFALGLGYRLRENEKKRREAHYKWIMQLEANKTLQDKISTAEAKLLQRQKEMRSRAEKNRKNTKSETVQTDHTQLILPGGKQIPIDELSHIEADRAYCKVYEQNGKLTVISKPLRYFEDLLPADFFWRSHKSYVINIAQIVECNWSENSILLKSGITVKLSRSKVAGFKKRLGIL